MATYQVFIEGQSFPVPPEIGENDTNVKRALSGIYPGIDNAGITRTEKDGMVTITVIKKAGSKGVGWNGVTKHDGSPLDKLIACPGGKNPAVKLFEDLQSAGALDASDPAAILALEKQVEQTIQEGERQAHLVSSAAHRLEESVPQASPAVVVGF